ncbi:MAG: YfhO family protein [Candidatus Hydrogenedentota bacterium]
MIKTNNFKLNEKVKFVLVYAALVFIIYYPVTFLERTFIPSLYYPSPVMDDSKIRPQLNTLSIDLSTPIYYEEPINKITGDMLKNNKLPLWNPYIGLGTPLAAQYSTRSFFPYQILENISPYWLWDYFVLFRFVLAGFFTFLFCRKLQLDILPSFIAGIIYQFSGSFVWFVYLEQMTNVGMMIPLLLYAIEVLLQNNKISNQLFLSVVIALILYAGQPEVCFYALALGFLYTLLGLWRRRDVIALKNELLKHIQVWIVAFMFASPLLMLFLELVFNSYHIHTETMKIPFSIFLSLKEIVLILLPAVILKFNFFISFPESGYQDIVGGYVSLFVWVAIFSLFLKREIKHRIEFIFFTVCGLSILLHKFGIPPFKYLGYLPFFNIIWFQKWSGPVFCLCLAITSAIGLQNISYISKKNIIISFIVILLLILLSKLSLDKSLAGITMPHPLSNFYNYSYILSFLHLICFFLILYFIFNKYTDGFQRTKLLCILIILELWFYIPKGYDTLWSYLLFIPLMFGWLSIIFIRKKFLALFFIIISLLSYIILELSSNYGLPLRRNPFPVTPPIKKVTNSQSLFRIIGVDGMFLPNYSGVYNLYDVRYINSLTPEETDNLINNLLLTKPLKGYHRLWFAGVSDSETPFYKDFIEKLRIYSFLGVRYIFCTNRIDLGLPVVYKGSDVTIFENKEFRPRTYIVFKTLKADNFKQAQQILLDNSFNFKEIAIIEKDINLNIVEPNPQWKTEIIKYGPDNVEILAKTTSDGILVLVDSYYRGWRVYVDGKEKEIFRINGLVRGVEIDKGEHIVSFKYRPLSFTAGCALFLIGTCYYILLLAVTLLTKIDITS